jgi:hypothetical protein
MDAHHTFRFVSFITTGGMTTLQSLLASFGNAGNLLSLSVRRSGRQFEPRFFRTGRPGGAARGAATPTHPNEPPTAHPGRCKGGFVSLNLSFCGATDHGLNDDFHRG